MERYTTIPKAALALGMDPKTLKRELERVCGLVFRSSGRGFGHGRSRSVLVAESDVQRVIDSRSGVHAQPGLRKAS